MIEKFVASFLVSLCIIHALAVPLYITMYKNHKNEQIQMGLKRKKPGFSQLERKTNMRVTRSNSCTCKGLKTKFQKNKYSTDLRDKKGKSSVLKKKQQNKTNKIRRGKRAKEQKCRLKRKKCVIECVKKRKKVVRGENRKVQCTLKGEVSSCLCPGLVILTKKEKGGKYKNGLTSKS